MNRNLLLLGLLVVLFVIYPLFFKKKNKHSKKQESAEKVLQKLQTIEHPAQKLAYLKKIDPFTFEELILTALQRKGIVIKRNDRYTGDGGIDGRFQHDGSMWLIQAKRYNDRVRLEHLKAFSALLVENQCNGIFVHTATTPKSVREASNRIPGCQLEIISGDRLLALFNSNIKNTF